MKVAKNMDSVFANCTDDELMFDILFDDDETIIDVLAGVDEAGNLITEMYFDESDEMVGENPDFEYQNDGDASGSEKNAEGTKGVKPEIGGEVGDRKAVSGKENSAESHANDTKDEEIAIGMHDKQQVKLEDAAEGPLEDDDPAEREGKTSDVTIETEATIDSLLSMLDEAEDPIEDGKCPVDCDKRAGEDHGVKNTEGKNAEVIGASIAGDVKKDIIADLDDAEQRGGKAEGNDTEGVKTHVVGAALESTVEDDLLNMLEAADEEEDISDDDVEDVADDVEDEGCCKESTDITDDLLSMLEAEEYHNESADEESEEDDAAEESEDEGCCKEAANITDKLLNMLEAEDPIEDGKCPVDSDKRAGEDHGVKNTEGKDTDVLGASILGSVHSDPLVDLDDAEQRGGKAEGDDTEGVKTHVVGAALEASDFVDDLLSSLDDDDDDILSIAGQPTVPDSVKTNGTSDRDIKEAVDAEEIVDEDEDDDDIETIEKDEIPVSDTDVEYDYDDDELIDAVINGDIDDMSDDK